MPVEAVLQVASRQGLPASPTLPMVEEPSPRMTSIFVVEPAES
jgi:hypothetical protein